MGDNKHAMIYEALVNVLGAENVSDDISVMQAYCRDWMPESTINPTPPDFVALPETVKEVQAVIKLATNFLYIFPHVIFFLHCSARHRIQGRYCTVLGFSIKKIAFRDYL